ncbi:MAG: type II secretion system protein [bacterium]|nr:type II secretion system protein [bacterium]
MKKMKRFTLIELIVVITIISILVAILMPVLYTIKERAKKTKAKAEMNAIITAIKSYEATYGILPVPESWTNGDTGTGYERLITLLTNVPYKGGSYDSYKNTRSIRFLDVPSDYITNGYLDPWDNNYKIYMDTDYTDELTGPDGDTLYGTVFLATEDKDGKDVYSWK